MTANSNRKTSGSIDPRAWSIVIALGLTATFFGCGGSSTSTQNLPPPTPSAVPFINQSLVPDTAAPGGAGFTLTVTGSGFVSDSMVSWNGSPRTTTFVSSSQLTASISASDIATAATASVTVVNPAAGGGSSNVVFFPVATPIASPALTGAAFRTGTGPSSVATGDFNGDGKLDLASNCFVVSRRKRAAMYGELKVLADGNTIIGGGAAAFLGVLPSAVGRSSRSLGIA